MIDFDYVTSKPKPLSEQEQKEVKNLLKIKTAKNKYEILVCPNINLKEKNDFFIVNDNEFKIISKNNKKSGGK